MGVIQRSADLVYTFRFIKLLVTRWEDTDAFKLGIIDKNGKQLKKVADFTTWDEKSAYTTFHRLVYNIKRIINKVPFVGSSMLTSLAAALWLIKEETGMSEAKLQKLMEKYCKDNNIQLDTTLTENNKWITDSEGRLHEGTYRLNKDVISPKTGEVVAKNTTAVRVREATAPSGTMFGLGIYEVEHIQTRQKIYVSTEDLTR